MWARLLGAMSCVTFVLSGLNGVVPAQVPAPPVQVSLANLQTLFDAYASGDVDVVAKEFEDHRNVVIDQRTLDALAGLWWSDWSPVRATFFLELAVAIPSRPATQRILSAGGTFVTQRPTPFGVDATQDAWEMTWHRAALALLESRGMLPEADLYMKAVGKRFAHLADAEGSRLELYGAIAQAAQCCSQAALRALDDFGRSMISSLPTAGGTDASGQSGLTSVAPNRGGGARMPSETEISDAIGRFDRLRKVADVSSEATVRGAWLVLYSGHASKALRWLDEAHDDGTHDDVSYWAAIVRGRVLDVLGKRADAVSAYRQALTIRPHAKTAGLNLALDLARLGRLEEAGEVTEAMTHDPYADDPWSTFDRQGGLAEVKRLLQTLRDANK